MKILLVDDDIVSHVLIKHIFIEHDVDFATTVAEAKELLKEKEYDVAIIDVMLPKANGYSLAAYIRTVLKLDIKIVMYSALPKERGISDAYIQKGGEVNVREAFYDVLHDDSESQSDYRLYS